MKKITSFLASNYHLPEGAFGIMKKDRFYKRIVRKGLPHVSLEVNLIACDYKKRV